MVRDSTPKSNKIKPASRFGRLLNVQSGETVPVLLLGGAILATEGGYWMGGNGVDGLVFGRLGSEVLPYLLMLKGLMAFTAITLYSRWLAQIDRRRMLIIITLATFLLLLVSRAAIAIQPPDWFFILLWPVSYVVPDLFMLQAWGLAGESFDSRQNKRLFPLISALGAVGVVAGNFLTYPLVQMLGAANLLLVWSVLVAVAFFFLYRLRRRLDRDKIKRRGRSEAEKERAEQASFFESLRMGLAVVRYYKIIGLMVVGTTLMYVLYYALFKIFISQVNDQFMREYPSDVKARTDAITGFFGLVGGGATLFSFLLGLLVVNRLFARLGVRNLMLALPITNLISFGTVLLATSFNTVVGARFIHLMMTEAFGASVNQTIYNLLPPETRETATPFNNQGISKQGGIVLAGLLLLLSLVSLPLVLGLAFALSVVYVLVAWRMRSLYRPSLVQLLREGQQNFFAGDELFRDNSQELEPRNAQGADALQAAILGLQDPSEGTRRISAEMLGQMEAPEAIQPLTKAVLMDASGEVRRTAISSLVQLNAPRVMPTIAEALTDPDSHVRAEAAGAIRQLALPLDYAASHFLTRALHDRDPLVRREAALTLLNYNRKGEALFTIWEMTNSEDVATRREAATAYGQFVDQVMIHCLTELLDDFQPEVRREAAISFRQLGGRVAVKALLASLEDDDPGVREEIAQSLATLRQQTTGPLLQYLFTAKNPQGAACALRGLTLARLEEKKLARHRNVERNLRSHQLAPPSADAGSEGRMLAGDLPGDTPILDLSAIEQRQLLDYGRQQLNYAARMAGYQAALSALDLAVSRQAGESNMQREGRDMSVLLKSLKERYEGAMLRTVDVVGLLSDVEALALVGSGLQAQGKRAGRLRADAIEALVNWGDSQLTPRLVELLEGREATVIQACRPGRTMSEILLEIWREGDAWLKACVLYVIGAFELRRLRPLVAEAVMIEGEKDYLIEETGQESLKKLDRRVENLDMLLGEMLAQPGEANNMQTLGTLSTMSRIVLLQKVPIFANLRPEDLRRVALVCKERLFSPGDIICYEGDPGDELYIVVSGQVQVVTGFGSQTHRVLATNQEGEAVGMMAILDDIPRSATLRVHANPVRLLILGADEFKRILRERPEMAAEVIRVLSRLLRETNRRIQENADFGDQLDLQPA